MKCRYKSVDCVFCNLIWETFPEGKADTPTAEMLIASHFHQEHLVPIRPYLVKR